MVDDDDENIETDEMVDVDEIIAHKRRDENDEMVEILDYIETDEMVDVDETQVEATTVDLDETVEIDDVVELVEFDVLTNNDEMVDVEFCCDELDELLLVIDDETVETQSQTSIDSFWMQDIFETNVWMQDDETDENDEIDFVISDEIDETVQIDDK